MSIEATITGPIEEEPFEAMLETIVIVESFREQAPESDLEYHEVALNSVVGIAREHLRARPDVVDVYRSAGEWAADGSAEDLASQLISSRQLLTYVRMGLLDTLTIDDLEAKIALLQQRKDALPYIVEVQRLFGDILDEQPVSDVPKKPHKKKVSKELTQQPELNAETVKMQKLVMDTLEDLEISPAMRAFVSATIASPARIEDLRNSSAVLQSMESEAYQEFKKTLSTQRQQVIEHLASKGLQATWELGGAARGRNYQLQVVADGQILTKPNIDRREKFENDLFHVVEFIIEGSPDNKVSQKHICEQIAEWLDIVPAHANELIERLVSRGVLENTGVYRGSIMLKIGEVTEVVVEEPVMPEQAPSQRQSRRSTKRKATKPRETISTPFSDDDIELAGAVCASVAALDSASRGHTIDRLGQMLDLDGYQIRLLVNRMQKAGVCKVDRVKSMSGNAGEMIQLVKFPSRGALQRFKSSAADYLSVLPRT